MNASQPRDPKPGADDEAPQPAALIADPSGAGPRDDDDDDDGPDNDDDWDGDGEIDDDLEYDNM